MHCINFNNLELASEAKSRTSEPLASTRKSNHGIKQVHQIYHFRARDHTVSTLISLILSPSKLPPRPFHSLILFLSQQVHLLPLATLFHPIDIRRVITSDHPFCIHSSAIGAYYLSRNHVMSQNVPLWASNLYRANWFCGFLLKVFSLCGISLLSTISLTRKSYNCIVCVHVGLSATDKDSLLDPFTLKVFGI